MNLVGKLRKLSQSGFVTYGQNQTQKIVRRHMKYLLDTDTLIGFIQGHSNTRARIVAMTEEGDLIGLCAVTVAELHSGVSEKNGLVAKIRSRRVKA